LNLAFDGERLVFSKIVFQFYLIDKSTHHKIKTT